jgi:polar amino acid transport system substrate-binding protein
MKKLIALVLCVLLTIGVTTACTGKSDVRTLKVAMSPDFAPMEFVDATKTGQDQFVGFDVTLAKYLASEMDMALEIVPMSFDACQTAVSMGQVDMAISGFSWMPDRAEKYNLSDTYHAGDNESNQVLLTTKDCADLYATAESLEGLNIGAQTASLQEWLVREQIPGAAIVPYTDITTGIMQLRKGDFVVMAVAEGNADAIIAGNDDLCKSGFYFELTDDLLDNLILMKKGNDELTATVNSLLAKAKEAGYYEVWYAEALEKAGVGVEISYDDEGNIATEG